jgi:preprotein translocase subunit SecA
VNGDWDALKNEYITSTLSMHDLSRKFNVATSTISRRAEAENWKQQRATFQRKTQQQVESVAADAQTRRILLLMQGGEKAATILCRYLDDIAECPEIKPQDIKAAAEALRSVRELFRTDDSAAANDLRKVRELLGGVPDALD